MSEGLENTKCPRKSSALSLLQGSLLGTVVGWVLTESTCGCSFLQGIVTVAVVRWHVPSRACEEGASRCTTPVGFGGWQKDFWGACEAVEGEANILVAFSRYPVIAIF